MKTIIFKIIQRKRIDIDMIPFEISKKYPVHNHLLYEATEKLVVYNFTPDSKLTKTDLNNYINYLKDQLKIKYNAYSVIVGEMQQQLKSPQ